VNVEAILGKIVVNCDVIGGDEPEGVTGYDVLDVNVYRINAGEDEWAQIILLVDHNGYYGGYMTFPVESPDWKPTIHHSKIEKNGDFNKPTDMIP
jgi:hypothetical protein